MKEKRLGSGRDIKNALHEGFLLTIFSLFKETAGPTATLEVEKATVIISLHR